MPNCGVAHLRGQLACALCLLFGARRLFLEHAQPVHPCVGCRWSPLCRRQASSQMRRYCPAWAGSSCWRWEARSAHTSTWRPAWWVRVVTAGGVRQGSPAVQASTATVHHLSAAPTPRERKLIPITQGMPCSSVAGCRPVQARMWQQFAWLTQSRLPLPACSWEPASSRPTIMASLRCPKRRSRCTGACMPDCSPSHAEQLSGGSRCIGGLLHTVDMRLFDVHRLTLGHQASQLR